LLTDWQPLMRGRHRSAVQYDTGTRETTLSDWRMLKPWENCCIDIKGVGIDDQSTTYLEMSLAVM